MKTYRGWVDADGVCHITVRQPGKPGRGLGKRTDIINHSTGFSWGYGGSGPAQTAVALLADALCNDMLALKLHQDFKVAVIAQLPQKSPWQMTDDAVRAAAAELDKRFPKTSNEETLEKIVGMHMAATRRADARQK